MNELVPLSATTAPLNISCPCCQAVLSVPHAGQYSCPSCGQQIEVSPAAPQPVASYATPQAPQIVRPRKVRETNGLGLLLEVVGVLLCLTIIGAIIGIPLLIAGGRMSYALRCGSCGNKLESSVVTLCPVCKCSLGTPMRGGFSFVSILVWGLMALFFGPAIIWSIWRLFQ